MKIGLVTTQFPSLTHAGGISFPVERLARALAERHGECSVLISRTGLPVPTALKKKYEGAGIRLFDLDGVEPATYPSWVSAQLAVRRALEPLELDHVIVQDWQGLGALLTAGPPVTGSVTSWLHGGQMYSSFGSGRYFARFPEYIESELERHQVETSSHVVSPSKFLMDWYRRQGWSVNADRESVIFNLMEVPPHIQMAQHGTPGKTVIAFIGSLTRRKGFDRLLDLCEQNRHRSNELEVRIFGVPLEYSARQTRSSLRKLGFEVHVETKWTTQQIWESLANSRALVVCPSRLDNSPNVVHEAATRGHHSFVWPSNGASELTQLFPGLVHTWNNLDLALNIVLNQRPSVPDVDVLNDSIIDQWLELLKHDAEELIPSNPGTDRFDVQSSDRSTRSPLISVVIASKNRMDHLCEALRSLILQDFEEHFEVIVIDDGSEVPYTLDHLPAVPAHIDVRIQRNHSHLGQGASRNKGAYLARSDLLVFADDDNLLRANHLSSLLAEWQRCGASAIVASHANHLTDDILTVENRGDPAFETVFVGDHLLPLGFMINTVGDTNFLVERKVFDAVGGWSEEWPTSIEDWELLLRIATTGYRVGATCTPTVDYRKNTTGVYARLFDGAEIRRIDTSVTSTLTPEFRNLLMLSRAAYTTSAGSSRGITTDLIKKGVFRFKREPLRTSMMAFRAAPRLLRRIRAQRRQ